MLKLARVVSDVFACALADDEHLAEMGFGLGVALESVFVSALFLADLAVPSEALEPLGLHRICEILGCSDFGSRHGSSGQEALMACLGNSSFNSQ